MLYFNLEAKVDLLVVMGIFMVVVIVIFLAVAFLLPEWVGITGKKAKDVMEHQQGDAPSKTDSH